MKVFLLFIITLFTASPVLAKDFVTISGRVTDYAGHPVDSCTIMLNNPDFSEACSTLSDADGYYSLDSIPKGRYAAIGAMRAEEYPRAMQVAPKDMKLEFWAWNVIADRDIRLDFRYEKLELYGTTAFMEYGGRPELLIYTRPMSVTKVLQYDTFMDKVSQERETIVTVEPQYMSFEVLADGKPLQIFSVQHLSLPLLNGNPNNDDCYLLQTELPPDIYKSTGKPIEIKVIGHNSQYDEHGENVYYMQPPVYDWLK